MRRFAVLVLALVALRAGAETVAVAAAANFVYVLAPLRAEFEHSHPGVAVEITTGASGNLFAQIRNGAPFDVFLSADTDYPRQIAAARLGEPATLRTFATGRLVLWTARMDLGLDDFATAIRAPAVRKIALAQPRTAPYGRAAEAALRALELWRDVQPKLVIGENISQTAQFVETGNADLGFLAMSLVMAPPLAEHGRWRELPPSLYAGVPLDHAGIVTRHGAGNAAARAFLDFLATPAARRIFEQFGYGTPTAAVPAANASR